MARQDIARTATRLRWAIWIVWGCILLVYVAGRLGLSIGILQVKANSPAESTPHFMILADATIVLVTVALWHLSRMLAAIAAGDLFSVKVVGAFRAFALWLLIVSLLWILVPVAMALVAGPGTQQTYEFKFQLQDFMTIGITLILFLVARLLERARAIDEEMREIV